MFKSVVCISFVLIFVSIAAVVQAGLEIDDKYGEIVALYRFNDATDSGPRGFDTHLREDATIVEGGKGTCLQLEGTSSFLSCCNDHFLALLNEFSIVAWVKLEKQQDPLNIGMHGIAEDGSSAGYANLRILPNGNLLGIFHVAPEERTLERHVEMHTHDVDVSDNEWHHIAFSVYNDIYNLFVDGQLVARRYVDDYISFISDKTNIYVTNTNYEGEFNGKVLVDEVGFFEVGFSFYEIRAIHQFGFDAFLKQMPVDPQGKMTTTWGNLKSR